MPRFGSPFLPSDATDDPPAAGLYDALLCDPANFGLPTDFGDDLHSDLDDEGEDEVVDARQHNAHVLAYRAHREREAHIGSLHGGVADIWAHLDGSPGCTRLGFSEEALHVRHLWADEADILAAPYEPTDDPPFPRATGYPHCTLPWWGWPPVVRPGNSALLSIFRIWRAHRRVTAQIAAAGGIDDDRGWITRPKAPDLSGLAEWRRAIFTPPSERAAAKAQARRSKRAASSRRSRAEHRAAKPRRDNQKPPITTADGFAFVPLSKGYKARVLAADAPLVTGHAWHVIVPADGTPYAAREERRPGGGKNRLRMHHVEGLTGPVEIIPPDVGGVEAA